ncbi:EamA family transporter [[Limnothrix rosea] IAM M-220]|nr:EamA family transporter [[Limnothrix rosea] IAM M-220]
MTDLGRSPTNILIWSVLIIGAVGVSTSSIFIRLAMAAADKQGIAFSLFLAASRLIFASIALMPTWQNVTKAKPTKTSMGYGIAAGLALALHFSLWISSLSFVSVAVSTSLVTTNPIWVALIGWIWQRKTLSRRTIIGIFLAIAGSFMITWSKPTEMAINSAPVLGTILALSGSIAASFYLVFGQEAQRQGLPTQSYATIAYTVAAIALLPMPILWGESYGGHSLEVYAYILAMTIIAQLIGHTSFNWALRWLPSVTVTLCILCEPIIASILSFFILKEIPSLSIIFGGFVILSGVAIAVLKVPQKL